MRKLKRFILWLSVFALCGTFSFGGVIAEDCGEIGVTINNAEIDLDEPAQMVDGSVYLPYRPIVSAFHPDAVAEWIDNRAVVTSEKLQMEIFTSRKYLIANGRYIYMEKGVISSHGEILIPARILAKALGADVSWDAAENRVVFTGGKTAIVSGDIAYQEDVVYWLSHIINAESGNQPLEGKIAVGNVIMNRVASPRYPDTVYQVIFQRGQFSPVSNNSILKTPNEDSVIAAKLVLDKAVTAEGALYFLNPRVSPGSWASRKCTYIKTIGDHAFYR